MKSEKVFEMLFAAGFIVMLMLLATSVGFQLTGHEVEAKQVARAFAVTFVVMVLVAVDNLTS